jgi:hypothetical protein
MPPLQSCTINSSTSLLHPLWGGQANSGNANLIQQQALQYAQYHALINQVNIMQHTLAMMLMAAPASQVGRLHAPPSLDPTLTSLLWMSQ